MIKKIMDRLARARLELRMASAGTGAPYRVETGRDMENYFAQVRTMCEPFANPFCYYEALVEGLLATPKLSLVPAADFAASRVEDRSLVCLRHDVDSDPLTALRAARYLASVGVSGSFYLLHTSPYYAQPYQGVVVRNPELVKWIHGFIVSGCELGLHNDALGVQANWGMNGIAAIRNELAWLRSLGANIRGSVAHNSGPVYGAENYEIFVGRLLWQRDDLTVDGAVLPLASVSEQDLGLTYEGTFARPKSKPDRRSAAAFFADLDAANIRSEVWMRTYLLDNPACDWGVDIQCWLLGKDMWVIAGRFGGREVFHWAATLKDLLVFLEQIPIGLRTLLVVHPEYVSN